MILLMAVANFNGLKMDM